MMMCGSGGGVIFLACEDFVGRMEGSFDESLPPPSPPPALRGDYLSRANSTIDNDQSTVVQQAVVCDRR